MEPQTTTSQNPSDWLQDKFHKVSLDECCKILKLDHYQDEMKKFLWNVFVTNTNDEFEVGWNYNYLVYINQQVLDFLGFEGNSYEAKKIELTIFFQNNPHIKYGELKSDCIHQYFVDSRNFEELIFTIDTTKSYKVQSFILHLKSTIIKYRQYIKLYSLMWQDLIQNCANVYDLFFEK